MSQSQAGRIIWGLLGCLVLCGGSWLASLLDGPDHAPLFVMAGIALITIGGTAGCWWKALWPSVERRWG